MPAYSLDFLGAIREIAEVENALIDGYPPPVSGHPIGSHEKFAIRIAAERMRIDQQSLRRRIGIPGQIGATQRRHGIAVDWGLFRPRPDPVPSPLPPPGIAQGCAAPPSDPVDLRRLRDENARLRASLAATERRAGDAEEYRASILALAAEPLRPRLTVPSRRPEKHGGRTVLLHLSDVHYGETISLAEMDRSNCYDAPIAQARLGRFFGTAAAMMTEHWSGAPPEEVVLCLGGDLISGLIHPELLETNFPAVPGTVREVAEHIAGGIVALRTRVGRPVRIYSVPGNHGRLTAKPQSKGRTLNSLDLLVTDFVEATLRGTKLKDVTFYRSPSPDALFSTYGWHWLLTHGDAMGGRGGGTGFIGPMATIIKGHRKLVDTSWRAGRAVHFVLTGHFHTTGKTPFGWSNGSVCGYGEYARDLRADPEPARQNMLVVHHHRGVISEQCLYLGAPAEGSHYAGPATVIRPVIPESDDAS